MQPERERDAVRDAVKELLDRSPAFRSLPPERQREVASNTVAVASAMAEAGGAVVREVDFPAFVADLVHGVFEAIVDASIQQMDAYAEMVAGVAKTVDRFREENVSDDDARAWLATTLPGIDGTGEATAALALDAARRSIAKQRQQLLATMVLMGVHRALDCDPLLQSIGLVDDRRGPDDVAEQHDHYLYGAPKRQR